MSLPMRHRQHVHLDVIAALVLWCVALFAVTGCTWLFAIGHPHAGLAFGFWSGVLAPAAGVVTLKCLFAEQAAQAERIAHEAAERTAIVAAELSDLIRIAGGIAHGPNGPRPRLLD